MHFAVALFSLLVVARSAIALIARESLPDCAALCLTNANAGICAPTDDTCLCKDKAFMTTIRIETPCSGSDLQKR
ncbi:hypothetical protein V8E55_002777 [Tylopilus felleus]